MNAISRFAVFTTTCIFLHAIAWLMTGLLLGMGLHVSTRLDSGVYVAAAAAGVVGGAAFAFFKGARAWLYTSLVVLAVAQLVDLPWHARGFYLDRFVVKTWEWFWPAALAWYVSSYLLARHDKSLRVS